METRSFGIKPKSHKFPEASFTGLGSEAGKASLASPYLLRQAKSMRKTESEPIPITILVNSAVS